MSKRKRLVLTTLLGLIFIAAASVFVFFHGKYVVPILMYHSVDHGGDPDNRLEISAKIFDRQIGFLKKYRYNVIPLEELAALVQSKKKIPPRSIVLTFDDGYKNFYTNVYPVLKKYNLPATMFIIVNEVGRPQNDRLSWDEIRIMRDSGIISFGSHTLGPEPLINIKSAEELKRQIFDSKRLLEEKLGKKVDFFSYPEGSFDAKIRQLVIDAGYSCAVATHPGLHYPNDDIFALKRLRISEKWPPLSVFAWQTSGYHTFLRDYQKEQKRKKNAKK